MEERQELFLCIKVKEMCWNVATTAQSSCWQVAGAWDEGGGTCVREKIEKDG